MGLASIKVTISGWSQRKVAIIGGTHRVPHIHERYGPRGDGACRRCLRAGWAYGRKIIADPAAPLRIVTAPSSSARKMPGMESSITPMTKQLSSVKSRLVPAAAWIRPPGKKLKVLQDVEKAGFPGWAVVRLGLGKRSRYAPPRGRD